MARISVSGPSSVVTDAAVRIGNEGGSVVDVAIVAALVAMCTEPGVCGPGGGGFLTTDIPGRDAVVIDGYMAYPGIDFDGEPELTEVTMPYGGGVTTLVGAGSIAVPGSFAALGKASELFGWAPWALLMETAALSVEEGFPLSPACHLYLNDGAAPIFKADPVVDEALFEGAVSRPLGATIVFPHLAETLRHLGSSGPEDFYVGDVARTMVADLSERGGQLTATDLAAYEAKVRKPLGAVCGDWRLGLNPAPAIGGETVARTLEMLEGDDPPALGRALTLAARERLNSGLHSPSTVSIAAADDEGGAVAASFSAGYGSGVIPADTGMLMNNALGELELVTEPGRAGERMVSNMAPTVGRRAGEVFALGSPGADRITTAVATTLTRIAAGDGLQDAIDHPRVHPEFGDDGMRLAAEPGQDLDDFEGQIRMFESPHMYFGGVNGAGYMAGRLEAHADARRTGSVGFTTP